MAQFSFEDHSIVGVQVPEAVLLMFFNEDWGWSEEDGVIFEWQRTDLARVDETVSEDVPEGGFPVPEVVGLRHRTWDDADVAEEFRVAGYPDHWLYGITRATKIGGLYFDDPLEEVHELPSG